MPSKGSKAASRQAKLRQNKRRGKAAPQITGTGPTAPATQVEPDAAVEEATPVAVEEPRVRAPARAPRPTRRERQQAAGQVAAVPTYLATELWQIGMIAGLIILMLVALTFVLGG